MIPEPLRVTLAVAKALERMGIPCFVGGYLVSSAHGVARSTLDADIIARLDPGQAGQLVLELGPEFYSDVDAIADAATRRSSFNVIHIATAFKVDVFVPPSTEYADLEMERRQSHVIDESTGEDGFRHSSGHSARHAPVVSTGQRGVGAAVARRARDPEGRGPGFGRELPITVGRGARRR